MADSLKTNLDVSVLEIIARTGISLKDRERDKLGLIPLPTVKSSVEMSSFRVQVLFYVTRLSIIQSKHFKVKSLAEFQNYCSFMCQFFHQQVVL